MKKLETWKVNTPKSVGTSYWTCNCCLPLWATNTICKWTKTNHRLSRQPLTWNVTLLKTPKRADCSGSLSSLLSPFYVCTSDVLWNTTTMKISAILCIICFVAVATAKAPAPKVQVMMFEMSRCPVRSSYLLSETHDVEALLRLDANIWSTSNASPRWSDVFFSILLTRLSGLPDIMDISEYFIGQNDGGGQFECMHGSYWTVIFTIVLNSAEQDQMSALEIWLNSVHTTWLYRLFLWDGGTWTSACRAITPTFQTMLKLVLKRSIVLRIGLHSNWEL